MRKNIVSGSTLVLGGGIGGLTAAWSLLKSGKKVLLIEHGSQLGGQMQAVSWKGFSVDLGQKQFYNRIPEVNKFMHSILGRNLRIFPFRTGVYYQGKVFERDRQYKGLFRGLPLSLLLTGLTDWAFQKAKSKWKKPSNLEELAYAQKGKLFTRIFSQGYDEKLKCRPWASVPVSHVMPVPQEQKGISKTLNKGESRQVEWFHPVKGSAGLIDVLIKEIKEMGGEILLKSSISRVHLKQKQIESIELKTGDQHLRIPIGQMVSSVRLEILAGLLGFPLKKTDSALSFQRSVIVVYLFLDKPVSYPHTCIMVNSPQLKTGRITNYGAYDCQMVPPGKGCLAFEIFCTGNSQLFQLEDKDLLELIKREFSDSQLFENQQVEGHKVYKLPLGDAGSSWEDYQFETSRKQLFFDISRIENLFNVHRTGIDKTIHAALLSSKSIQMANKEWFLARTAPEKHQPWISKESPS